MKIYTGGGDAGMTSLSGGDRVPKTHPRIEAFGTIDELNSFIGLLITELDDVEMKELLHYIQSKLFTIGSCLAVDPIKMTNNVESSITFECIQKIEDSIDKIDHQLPKINAFILPGGGSRAAALAHVCRTVCRRTERVIFRLAHTEHIHKNVFVLINRLSDLLFVIARQVCVIKKGEEIFWENSCK